MDVRNININEYSYYLPEDKIAKYPLPYRDASSLLVYKDGQIQKDIYHNIANYLPEHSIMIFNNTKVIEARLFFQKQTGGVIEIFCLEPADDYHDLTSAMVQHGSVLWKCLIGGASKWKHGLILEKKIDIAKAQLILKAKIHQRESDTFIIEFSWRPVELSFAEVLHFAGAMPLPPYIKREAEESDSERYQTIYAMESGSVAAPTAGLHFTPSIFSDLSSKDIEVRYVTLHVGAGTFKPVKTHNMAGHEMHAESFEVDLDFLNRLLIGKKAISVGTTSARTMESLYWLGVKTKLNPAIESDDLHLGQWEAYELRSDISTFTALTSLIEWMNKNKLKKLVSKTKLLIAPGYRLRIMNILITNFHQPQSTLLLLVAAVAGNDWRKIYNYALSHNFRFLSYGDGCLIYAQF